MRLIIIISLFISVFGYSQNIKVMGLDTVKNRPGVTCYFPNPKEYLKELCGQGVSYWEICKESKKYKPLSYSFGDVWDEKTGTCVYREVYRINRNGKWDEVTKEEYLEQQKKNKRHK